MDLGTLICIITVLLFVLNFLVMLAGIALIVCGILAQIHFIEYKELFNNEFSWVAVVIIIIGIVICLVGFCGCCGTFKNSSRLLTMYGVFLMIIVVLQIAIGAVVLTQVAYVISFVNNHFAQFFMEQYAAGPTNPVLDALQVQFECCGVQGPGDYASWNLTNFEHNQVPDACCSSASSNPPATCNVHTSRSQGCLQYFTDFISGGVQAAGEIVLAFAVLELLAIISSRFLVRQFRRVEDGTPIGDRANEINPSELLSLTGLDCC